jgi:hypothetical protein
MLNTNAQTQFAEATADLFDLYSRAGAHMAWASADQGMALWLNALQFAARRADARMYEWRSAFLPWMDLSAAFMPTAKPGLPRPTEGRPGIPTSEAPYASYRTAGGHAVAQIIFPGDRT